MITCGLEYCIYNNNKVCSLQSIKLKVRVLNFRERYNMEENEKMNEICQSGGNGGGDGGSDVTSDFCVEKSDGEANQQHRFCDSLRKIISYVIVAIMSFCTIVFFAGCQGSCGSDSPHRILTVTMTQEASMREEPFTVEDFPEVSLTDVVMLYNRFGRQRLWLVLQNHRRRHVYRAVERLRRHSDVGSASAWYICDRVLDVFMTEETSLREEPFTVKDFPELNLIYVRNSSLLVSGNNLLLWLTLAEPSFDNMIEATLLINQRTDVLYAFPVIGYPPD